MSDQEDTAQPWREARQQPAPKAIEGQHAGRRVPESEQRATRDDSGVGAVSRVAGDDAGGGSDEEGGMGAGSTFGGAGSGHQGLSETPGGRTGSTHAHGRSTEDAFGEEESAENASPLNDYRDAAISRQEIGPSGPGDRTQGGSQ